MNTTYLNEAFSLRLSSKLQSFTSPSQEQEYSSCVSEQYARLHIQPLWAITFWRSISVSDVSQTARVRSREPEIAMRPPFVNKP